MRNRILLMGALVLSLGAACNKEKTSEQKLAPTASALEAAMPQAPGAAAFQVDAASSSLWSIDVPSEGRSYPFETVGALSSYGAYGRDGGNAPRM